MYSIHHPNGTNIPSLLTEKFGCISFLEVDDIGFVVDFDDDTVVFVDIKERSVIRSSPEDVPAADGQSGAC